MEFISMSSSNIGGGRFTTSSRHPPVFNNPPQPSVQGGQYQSLDDKIDSNLAAINKRLERLEGIPVIMENLVNKLERVHGFAVHEAQHLATKAELEKSAGEVKKDIHDLDTKLNEKISNRPTTLGMIAIVGVTAQPAFR